MDFSRRARVARIRIELLDKRVVASLEPAAFGESRWLEAIRQGVEQAEHVVFVSDAAPSGGAWRARREGLRESRHPISDGIILHTNA